MLSPIEESLEEDTLEKLEVASKGKSTLQEVIGGHGPWQFRHWLVFFTASVCNSLHLFSVFPFSSAIDCKCGNLSETFPSATSCNTSECGGDSIKQGLETSTACANYYGGFVNSEQDGLFCSNTNLVIYAKCIYFFGVFLSGPTIHLYIYIFGGRRLVSLISGLFLSALCLAIGWAGNSATFLILRFLISHEVMNIYLISIFSLKECVGDEYTLLYGLTGHIGWGLAHFILPLVTWIAGNWMNFSIVISSPSLILFIILCFIPESVERYASKGLHASAQKIIRKAAWSNGYSTQDTEEFVQTVSHRKTQESMRITCKQGNFQTYFEMALLFLIGFSASFLYFMSIWLTDWRQVDRGSYFALIGTTEVASTIVLLFFSCFFSPKHLWSATTIMAAISLLTMYAKSSDDYILPTAPYLLTMFFSSAACTIVQLRTLFRPFSTSVSKWNAFITSFAFCVGAAVASLNDLQKSHDWNPKLFVIFGIPNLTIGATIAVIPNREFQTSTEQHLENNST